MRLKACRSHAFRNHHLYLNLRKKHRQYSRYDVPFKDQLAGSQMKLFFKLVMFGMDTKAEKHLDQMLKYKPGL